MKRLYIASTQNRAHEAQRVDSEARASGWWVIIQDTALATSVDARHRLRAAIKGATQCNFVCSYDEMFGSEELQFQMGVATGAGIPTTWQLPTQDHVHQVERTFDLVHIHYVDIGIERQPVFRELERQELPLEIGNGETLSAALTRTVGLMKRYGQQSAAVLDLASRGDVRIAAEN